LRHGSSTYKKYHYGVLFLKLLTGRLGSFQMFIKKQESAKLSTVNPNQDWWDDLTAVGKHQQFV
jgi:hypothetical protein